jgi:thiopeptide-type bacteriocin biosynthesis protein
MGPNARLRPRRPHIMNDRNARAGYAAMDFLLARVPLLPIDILSEWSDVLDAGSSDEWLLAIVRRPDVLAAIAVSSPAFARALRPYLFDGLKLPARIRRSVVRYILRMTGRSTPFGLFAATVRGSVGPVTHLRLEPREEARVFLRIDGIALYRILRGLTADDCVRRKLPLEINQSAYEWGGRLHYIEAFVGKEGVKPYVRSSAEVDAPLRLILDLIRVGGATTTEVVHTLTRAGFPESDATEYVDQLISEQILIAPAAHPCVIDVPHEHIAKDLEQHAHATPLFREVQVIATAAREASAVPLFEAIKLLDRTQELMASAGFAPDDAPACDAQLRLAGTISIGPCVVGEIEQAATVLAQIHLPSPTSPSGILARELDAFQIRFTDRFGDAAVPLSLAIDPDVGVGFRGADVPFADPPDAPHRWEHRDRYLLNRVASVIARGDQVMRLSEQDVDEIALDRDSHLPTSAILFARISNSGNDRHTIYIGKFGGPTATSTLGRFACGDAAFANDLRAAPEAASGEFIDAEIIHAPTGDLLNIVSRPHTHEYEIAFLGRGSVESEKTLTCNDLLVSVQDNRVVLYSRRLGRVVRPHLTCAHAAHHNELPAMYRFLFAVACQGSDPLLMWQWGIEIDALRFLPRVEYRSTVLSSARWRLVRDDLDPLIDAVPERRLAVAEELRARLRIPRVIAVMTPSEELLFDLGNRDVLADFTQLAKQRGQLEIVEVFPEPGQSAVTGADGQYMHEILVPMKLRAPRPEPATLRFHPEMELQETAFIGDRWLYIRIEAGARAAEELLLTAVAPLLEDFRRRGFADEWFFVRYADPNHHLRLRVRGDADTLHRIVLPALVASIRKFPVSGSDTQLRIDTYRPEIRRYGGAAGMRCAEQFFSADSAAIVSTLLHAREMGVDADPDWRMAYACMTTQHLLVQLVASDEKRLSMLARLAEAALHESVSSNDAIAARRRQLGQALRRRRQELARATFVETPEWRAVHEIFARHMADADRAIGTLIRLRERRELTIDRDDIALSLIHMHLNRVFMEEPRFHERVVYDFLYHLNRSHRARSAGTTAVVPASGVLER